MVATEKPPLLVCGLLTAEKGTGITVPGTVEKLRAAGSSVLKKLFQDQSFGLGVVPVMKQKPTHQ